ncbi:hypothetical protein DF3PB_10102 [uncultured Defluviicoccus sp.]|uniref:Uncharacterized protein n=1 Tax=metagenome TaxID=256318 RepID=A0A380T858_9ZZZZ|nr:hypothetical protein DF3PB_10102 [uncultured Defluviicoccus sp.]
MIGQRLIINLNRMIEFETVGAPATLRGRYVATGCDAVHCATRRANTLLEHQCTSALSL